VSYVLLISSDTLFSHMLVSEMEDLHCTVRAIPNLSYPDFESMMMDSFDKCHLLILDLDVEYIGLEKILNLATEQTIPVVLFGHPNSPAMTADKQRFYDSDIYRYVFQRPFLMNQFLYCVRELLQIKEDDLKKRSEEPVIQMKQRCSADDLRINEYSHLVYYKNDLIHLTKTEYDVLSVLMRQRGVVLSRMELYAAVWGDDEAIDKKDSNIVDVYIRYLRSKLDDRYQIKLIETVRGVGYTIRK